MLLGISEFYVLLLALCRLTWVLEVSCLIREAREVEGGIKQITSYGSKQQLKALQKCRNCYISECKHLLRARVLLSAFECGKNR